MAQGNIKTDTPCCTMSSKRRMDERRNVLKMLNDYTPLPTVLQEMIAQYLLPNGYTLVYDTVSLQYVGNMGGADTSRTNKLDVSRFKHLFVPYDTHQSPVQLPNLWKGRQDDEVWNIARYKQGLIVHSEDDDYNVHIELYTVDNGPDNLVGSEAILLLDKPSDTSNMHWMCVFQDRLIIQTRSTYRSDGISYTILNLQHPQCDVDRGIQVNNKVEWDQFKRSERGTFVSMSDKYLLYLTTDRSYQFDDIDSAIANRPSKVLELKTTIGPLSFQDQFVVSDTDIYFMRASSGTIVCLSTVTGEQIELPALPERYNLLPSSIDDRIVAVGPDNAVTYCKDSRSWAHFTFPLVAFGTINHFVCMEGGLPPPLTPRQGHAAL